MTRAHTPQALVIVGVLVLGAASAPADEHGAEEPAAMAPGPPRAVTVPFTLDHNRMIVEVELVRPDGTVMKAPAWVDTGAEVLVVTEAIARELGLDMSGLEADGSHGSAATDSPAPGVRIGGLPLDMEGIPTWVRRGAPIMPGVPAQVHLGASALRHDHVVLDYPAQRLTVARPGVLEPRGVAVPCRVNPTTGLFMISAAIDGEAVPLGLDNGSAGTWVSKELTGAWQERHPGWRHVRGALGSTNFWGEAFETDGALMRLPEVGIGSIRPHDIAVLGLGQPLFNWYSRKSAGPVVGFLGANVLRRFRLEVDFADQMTYWEAGPQADDHDLDIVGITVRAGDDGGFRVAGVVSVDGEPAVTGVAAGDRLLRIGQLEVAGATMGQVIQALRGRPGETRVLEVAHDDMPVTVRAPVMRFP